MDQCVITQQGYRFSVQPAFTVTAAPKAKNVTRFRAYLSEIGNGAANGGRHRARRAHSRNLAGIVRSPHRIPVQVAEDAFGNALGNAAIAGIQAENARNATKPAQAAIEINPGSPQLQVQDLNMQLAPIGPVSYTVQSGDSLSGILGTSDPAAIGAFMQANGLTSSTIYPGEQLVMPSGGYTEGDAALGQATLNVDNQRIAALQASNNGYGADIQFVSPGEQEEAFNLFPSATYAAPTADGGGAVNGVLQWLAEGRIYSDIPAFANGAYQGIQKVPGEMEAAAASVWGGIKSGWAHVSSPNALGSDVLSLDNEIHQLPEQLPQLLGEVQNWAMGLGNRVEQDGAQLLNYLRNTPDTQIAYDAGYGITSHAPMIALAIGTDGLGEVADGGELIGAAGDASASSLRYVATGNVEPLGYDISEWGSFGLPSDGYFARTLNPKQAYALLQGKDISFGGAAVDGYPDGMGFLSSAEEVSPLQTADEYASSLDLDYKPQYLLAFQLRDPTGLQNVLEAPYPKFVPGGKSASKYLEWNYPGINSKQIVNWRLRAFK